MDTIFALATAPGRAGVSIIRVSGTLAKHVSEFLTGKSLKHRQASYVTFRGADGTVIDTGLALYFKEGKSFTGESVVEFHLHGSRAVVARMFQELGEFSDVRQALPGEFTKRALINGKLSLTQVEGLADLIDAETESQRKLANRIMVGELRDKSLAWRSQLVRAAALLEASLDFADDEVPYDVTPEVTDLVRNVANELRQDMKSAVITERVQSGFEVAIVGRPNVGKSTLLNYLAGRDAAITSEIAGTTRDVIEVRMDLNGLAVTLVDTAGIHDSTEQIEKIGIELALKRFEQSDIAVFVVEPGRSPVTTPRKQDIVVQGKADLIGEEVGRVSGVTGYGMPELVDRISSYLSGLAASAGMASRERHRHAITNAFDHLNAAGVILQMGVDKYEIVAEELRAAVHDLDGLIGRVDVEDLLDEIFSSFCIGK